MAEFIITKQYDSECWQCLKWVVEMDGKCKFLLKVTLHLQEFDAKKKLQKYEKYILFILKFYDIFSVAEI